MPETTSDSPAAPTIDGTTSTAASATNAPTASAASPTPTFAGLRQVSDGWIKKYVLTYTMPDGSTYQYESASRKGPEAYRAELEAHARGESAASDAVCIVPQTPDGRLLLIREFRYPLNSWCIAFPAGLVDPGEDLAAAVDRELREETGYAPASPTSRCRWCSRRWNAWPTRNPSRPSASSRSCCPSPTSRASSPRTTRPSAPARSSCSRRSHAAARGRASSWGEVASDARPLLRPHAGMDAAAQVRNALGGIEVPIRIGEQHAVVVKARLA